MFEMCGCPSGVCVHGSTTVVSVFVAGVSVCMCLGTIAGMGILDKSIFGLSTVLLFVVCVGS